MSRPPDSGDDAGVDQVDTLEALGEAAAILIEHPNGAVRAIGGWLAAGGDAALYDHLAGDAAGHSWSEAKLAWRDDLLRRLATGISARVLSVELDRYATRLWPRDRLHAACPYPRGSRNAALWTVLALRGGHYPGSRQLARILSSDPSQCHRDRP
jgi:hypothetical protein